MRDIKFKIKYHRDDKVHGPYSANELCKRVPSNIEDVGVMLQYTGLKDKNEKEIYEGDVVDVHIFGFNGNETEHEFRAVIEWCEEFAGVGLRVIENISSSLGKGGLNPIASIYGMHEESFEIIGNVHENPELIKL